jgi:hypothetical protein
MVLRKTRSWLTRYAILVFSAALPMGALAAPRLAFAAGPTKDECVEAHSKGQDAREAGQISLARKLFLTCAQGSCPGLVQGDCARFSDELDRLQPTVSFSARDQNGADLPDTTVYVDGVLTATHLDDGKVHDVDPGHHTVRFINGGREMTTTIVVNQGEKGRVISAAFRSASTGPSAGPARPEPVQASRSVAPLIVVGVGVAMMATGGVLGIVGLNKVPSSCSVSTRECAAAPGDPVFEDAKSGIALADVGLAVGITGAIATAGGLLWYFSSPRRIETGTGRTLTPWFTAHGGGVAFGGTL